MSTRRRTTDQSTAAPVEPAVQPAPEPVDLAQPELALVQVVVSHDLLRAGEQGEVELTPRVRALLDQGYLRLLGHVRAGGDG